MEKFRGGIGRDVTSVSSVFGKEAERKKPGWIRRKPYACKEMCIVAFPQNCDLSDSPQTKTVRRTFSIGIRFPGVLPQFMHLFFSHACRGRVSKRAIFEEDVIMLAYFPSTDLAPPTTNYAAFWETFFVVINLCCNISTGIRAEDQ